MYQMELYNKCRCFEPRISIRSHPCSFFAQPPQIPILISFERFGTRGDDPFAGSIMFAEQMSGDGDEVVPVPPWKI